MSLQANWELVILSVRYKPVEDKDDSLFHLHPSRVYNEPS